MLGFMCETEVTIAGETLAMWLPVMDGANKAMRKEGYSYTTRYGEKQVAAATMFDINKTLMRCLVKNLAMFGMGIQDCIFLRLQDLEYLFVQVQVIQPCHHSFQYMLLEW